MKTAVITGASSGMGREFVYAIDREYAPDEIWVIARREAPLHDLQDKCNARIVPLLLDLLDQNALSLYQARLEAEQPELCVVVNAAGFGLFGAFTEMDIRRQLDIIDLNAKALTAMCYLSIPYMPAGSAIVNLASNSSWQPVPYINVYAASKAYVMSFSRSLGVELKEKGILVLAVAPGWIKTEFFDHAVHDDTIKYYDRFYTAEEVVQQAMKDLRKRKAVSILGAPVRRQVKLVKHLPVSFVMKIWCRQQGK